MTKSKGYSIRYPRRRAIRGALRGLVRLLLRLLACVEIAGEEHLPEGGPLLVVGNHIAILEAPLMMTATPWTGEGRVAAWCLGTLRIDPETFEDVPIWE